MGCPAYGRYAWTAMVQAHNGNEIAADKEWRRNGEEFPQKYLDEEAKYYNDQGQSIAPEPVIVTPENLRLRLEVLNKAINTLKKRLKALENLKDPSGKVQHVVDELKTSISRMTHYQADKALLEFIKTANVITESNKKWITDMKSGKEPLSLKNLKRIKDFINAVNIIDSIKEDFFADDSYKDQYATVLNILSSKNKILNDYKELSIKLISNMWEPNFHKVEAIARRDAEFDFNTSSLAKNLSGEERRKARDKYVNDHMIANAPLIRQKSLMYIRQLLTNTEDIDAVSAMLVNPKDIGNPLMTFAVEAVDKADFELMTAVNKKTFEARALVNKFFTQVGKKANPEEQYSMLLEIDKDGIIQLVNPKVGLKKYNDIKKGKYKGTSVEQLYDFLVQIKKDKDSWLPVFARKGFKMPSMEKNTLERLYSNGAWHTAKEGFLDIYKMRSTDVDYGDIDARTQGNINNQATQVITNEFGEERQHVPIFFRGKVDAKDQSHDVVSLFIMDYQNSLNFKLKTETGILLDILKDTIAEAGVLQRSFVKNQLKVDEHGQLVDPKKGVESNLYKAIDNLIQHRIHGIGLEGSPQAAKIVNKAKSWVSHTSLILNKFSAVSNLLQGTTMNWIEAIGGTQGNYGYKNRINASLKYNKDLINITKDLGEEIPTSKTGLLLRLFNANSDWSGLNNRFVLNNKLKRMANIGTLHALSGITEYSIQAIGMYAVLDNIKVLDENGDFLDSNFKPTQDRSKAISLDEAFRVVDGELQLHDGVVSTERTDDVDKELFHISQLIRSVNRKLYGNYDSKNKSKFQRTIIGNLVMHMRGWLVSGMQYHWRGVFKHTKQLTQEELAQLTDKERETYELNQIANIMYNENTGKFEEGIYTSLIKLIKRSFQEFKLYKMQTFSENWKKLSEDERRNIYKVAVEGMLIFLAFVIASIAMGGDDDKEKMSATDLFLAYSARRLYSELFTYANINEGLRTFRSPAISLNAAENLMDLFVQMTDPTERYEQGARKGDLKLSHRAAKLIPIWSQMDRSTADALTFLMK